MTTSDLHAADRRTTARPPLYPDLIVSLHAADVARSVATGMRHAVGNAAQALELWVQAPAEGVRADPAALLDTAARASTRLTSVVRVLSDTIRDTEPEAPVVVADLLENVGYWERFQYDLSRVSVRQSVAPRLPAVLGWTALRQALLALVANAKEAVEAVPEPEILLAAEADDGGVKFVVQDNGPGIPHEDRERVFEPGYTTRPGARRLGIGLAAARVLAGQLGGRVWVEGRRDAAPGAKFCLWVPAVPPRAR
jgi:C4-dicarboxylate-specific signal transduction histidine kinase